MVMKNVKVEEKAWWRLSKIKVNNKLKSISEAIEFVLKKLGEKE